MSSCPDNNKVYGNCWHTYPVWLMSLCLNNNKGCHFLKIHLHSTRVKVAWLFVCILRSCLSFWLPLLCIIYHDCSLHVCFVCCLDFSDVASLSVSTLLKCSYWFSRVKQPICWVWHVFVVCYFWIFPSSGSLLLISIKMDHYPLRLTFETWQFGHNSLLIDRCLFTYDIT